MLGDYVCLAVGVPIIPKVFDGVEVRALCWPVKFFHSDLDKPFLHEPRFVHGDIVMLKQERDFPKLLPQSWKHRIIWDVIVCCCDEISFHWKGPSPNDEKQPQTIIIPPPPNFTVGTKHLDR